MMGKGNIRVFKEMSFELNIIHTSEIMERKGVSTIISVVIITATLMIILVVASFFATNLLEIQMQSSEFEQAKTTMLLLDKTIMDVSLRHGAVSSMQFSQRSGGIGLYRGDPINITIFAGSNKIWNNTIDTYIVKYRGGSLVSATETNLTNPGGLIVGNIKTEVENGGFGTLGHVRVKIENGAWIVLDYNRVRVTINKGLGTMDIYLVCLEPGTFGGSGTATIRVQNARTNVDALTVPTGQSNEISLVVHVAVGGLEERSECTFSGVQSVRIRVIVVYIRVSIV